MIKEKDLALDREINKVMEIEHQREERIRSRFRLDKENTSDAPPSEEKSSAHERSKESRRKSHEKKERHSHHSHKEAKKKQHEMQYDDEEEEMEEEEEEEEPTHMELGDHVTGPSGGEGGKGSRLESENERMVEIKEEVNREVKTDKVQESLDDGNNTDVDYEDEETNEEEERNIISREMLSSIPMPPEPITAETKGGEVPMESEEAEKEEDKEQDTVQPLRQAQGGGEEEEELDEQEIELMEARRRRAMMAEGGEDMADEPADE